MPLAEQVMKVDPNFFYDVDPIATVYAAMGRCRDGTLPRGDPAL